MKLGSGIWPLGSRPRSVSGDGDGDEERPGTDCRLTVRITLFQLFYRCDPIILINYSVQYSQTKHRAWKFRIKFHQIVLLSEDPQNEL